MTDENKEALRALTVELALLERFARSQAGQLYDKEQLSLLLQGATVWNSWRKENPDERVHLAEAFISRPDSSQEHLQVRDIIGPELPGVDLHKADLSRSCFIKANLSGANLKEAFLIETELTKTNLSEADLSKAYIHSADLREVNLKGANLNMTTGPEARLEGADLSGANLGGGRLSGAKFQGATLIEADLSRADLKGADLRGANFQGAKLNNADLTGAYLEETDLSGANLSGADLTRAALIETKLNNTVLSDCRIYGISVWDVKGKPGAQTGLVITPPDQPIVTVDDLEVAQFIYLLLNRQKLRNVLTTITSKAVLLLGRFTPERKAVLDALADELRKNNLLPIIFDFERSTNRDFTETIKILAGLSLFVVVDITKPKSAPQELTATVPDYQIPFVPILEEGEPPYSMFDDFKKYDWVLKPVLKYRTKEVLLENFRKAILERAWKKHVELQNKKNEELEVLSIEDIIEDRE